MASYLQGKAVIVLGGGDEQHRGVAVALAQAGADVAVAGHAPDLSAEAALHSIANEIWALGRRASVVALPQEGALALPFARQRTHEELGRVDLVVRCEA